MAADSDQEESLYVCGDPYFTGWLDARDAAKQWMSALEASGMDVEGLRVRPCTGACGGGEVQVWATPEQMRWVAELVTRGAEAARGREAC